MKQMAIKMDARPIAWKAGEGESFLPWDTVRQDRCWGVVFEDGSYYTPFIQRRQVRSRDLARLFSSWYFYFDERKNLFESPKYNDEIKKILEVFEVERERQRLMYERLMDVSNAISMTPYEIYETFFRDDDKFNARADYLHLPLSFHSHIPVSRDFTCMSHTQTKQSEVMFMWEKEEYEAA